MSRLAAKAVVSVRVEEGTSLHFTQPVIVEVLLTAGLWYILGDGTPQDLLEHILDQAVSTSAALNILRLDIDSDTGVVTASTVGADISITWVTGLGGSGLDISDYLRMERYGGSITMQLLVPVPGYRAAVGCYYCTNYLLEDLDEWEDYSAQMIPDDPNANPTGIKIARRRYSNISYQSEGFPRDTSVEFNEYHELVSFFEEAGSYRPFRIYYNRDGIGGDDAYASNNRLGYQVYVITRASTSQRPDPVTADYYLQFKQSFRAVEYKET
jgi:hypothetical protein